MDTRGVAGRHWSELDVSADTKRFEAAGVKGLLDSLNALFAQRHESGDVTFYCTGDAGGCETAHELVLALRSDYLKALLRWADAAPGTRRALSLASFPFTRPVLTALLEYFYTGSVSFTGPENALDVLEAAHYTTLFECCALAAHWLCASLGESGTAEATGALLALCTPGKGLHHDPGVNNLLKVTALKTLLPRAHELGEAEAEAVAAGLGSCTSRECASLGVALVVDACDDTPLAAGWCPTNAEVKLVSPRQEAGSDETLCVLNLRATDIHVNWVSFTGDETHYSQSHLKSNISPGGMTIWRSYVGHLWRVYDVSSTASTWLGGFAVGDSLKSYPLLKLLRVSACIGGTLQLATTQLQSRSIEVPPSVTQLVVVL